MNPISRRKFLKISGATIGVAAASSTLLKGTLTKQEAPKGVQTVPTFCDMCFWKCGAIAYVKDGELWKVEGNPLDPLSRGRLCPRGTGGVGAHSDPDRLRAPLIRRSTRGKEEWVEVTWDEALNVIAEKMQAIKANYGPEAVALFSHGIGGNFLKHTLKAFGTPNIAAPSFAQCRGPRDVGFRLTFGEDVSSPERTDIKNAKCLVLIGSHLGENMHNTQVQEFAEAIRRGAKIAVVDPRFSVAASKANWYLPIKPGTDTALLMAWAHVLVNEGIYNRAFVEKYATGFDEFKAAIQEMTPEWAEKITEIPAELIRTVAREMAAAQPSVIVHPGRHVTWYGDDAQRSRAIAILNALVGSWGAKGGFFLPSGVEAPPYPAPPLPKPQRGAIDGAGNRYPLADETLASGLCDATLAGAPYRARGWLVYGTNLLQSLPQPQKTLEAIQALDLLVVIDVLPVEIAGYADVVLPECTYLERYDDLYAGAYRTPFVALRQPAVAPMYDSKPGWWMVKELAKRLDLEAYFPWKHVEEYLDTRLRGLNLNLADMKKRGVVVYPEEGTTLPPDHKFDTPSGKIELYSKMLADMGVDPVPKYYPKPAPPEGHFRLLFGRSPLHTFGRTTNNRVLGSVVRENEVWIHNKAAAALGVRHNERVRLVNQDGVQSAPVRARVTNRIRPDCVYMVHGFGHTARNLRFTAGRGASTTDLVTRVSVDPLMGGTGMFNNFVRIEKEA